MVLMLSKARFECENIPIEDPLWSCQGHGSRQWTRLKRLIKDCCAQTLAVFMKIVMRRMMTISYDEDNGIVIGIKD